MVLVKELGESRPQAIVRDGAEGRCQTEQWATHVFGLVGAGEVQRSLQRRECRSELWQRCRQLTVVPPNRGARNDNPAKDVRPLSESIKGKEPAERMPKQDSEGGRTVPSLHVRNQLLGEKPEEFVSTPSRRKHLRCWPSIKAKLGVRRR